MSEMIERVAKALFAAQNGGYTPMWAIKWEGLTERGLALWRNSARQAIQAMRDPTRPMVTAARRVQLLNPGEYEDDKGYFAQAYKYMIDEALK